MSWYAHLVDAGLTESLNDLTLGTAPDLLGLNSHDFCWGEGEGLFLVLIQIVIVGQLVDNLLDLLLLEAAHEP